MGFIIGLLIIGIICYCIYQGDRNLSRKKQIKQINQQLEYLNIQVQQELKKIEAEQQRRQSIPCLFYNSFPFIDFCKVVYKEIHKYKKIKKLVVKGPYVYCNVTSNSGQSAWAFLIDYNDYGMITGRYWKESQNDDSTLPATVADNIASSIRNYDSRQYITFPSQLYGNMDAINHTFFYERGQI